MNWEQPSFLPIGNSFSFPLIPRTPLMTLPDYGFELIPEVYHPSFPFSSRKITLIFPTSVEAVINILLYSLIASCAVLLLTLGDHLLIFRRIVLMLGITALLRPLIFCMTSLPDPCEWGHIKTYPSSFVFLSFIAENRNKFVVSIHWSRSSITPSPVCATRRTWKHRETCCSVDTLATSSAWCV
mgnify:CR=1 FL=1